MARKVRYESRCIRCSMRKELCLCAEIRSFRLETRLILVMHWRETRSTTNTGRLAMLALPNSELRIRGHRTERLDGTTLCSAGRTTLLLYPAPDAAPLTPALVASLPRPFTLVVPDGTWRQAAKVGRREPGLTGALPVCLPEGPRSYYSLRRAPQAHCLSTMEAIARALGIIEGEEIRIALDRLLRCMVDRTLSSRSPDSRAAITAATPLPSARPR